MGIDQTLEILDRLIAIGFDDEAFWRTHHFRARGHKETVASFRGYCVKMMAQGSVFQAGGTNEKVHLRLKFILKTYEELGLSPGQKKVFPALAEAAYFGIPSR